MNMEKRAEQLTWFQLGLKEVGLTEKEYRGLKPNDKKVVDKYLEELGHL
jgi:hypothetical protein